jgi:MraZ protein
MFLGDYQHTLDAKGRVSLPKRFRDELSGTVIVAKGFDRCLYVYSDAQYQEFVATLPEQDLDPAVRQLRRFFTTGAVPVDVDTAGRIILSQALREYAGLKRDVAVTGNDNHIEIWDAETWAAYNSDTEDSIEDLARGLAAVGPS